jgi:hypothetical protein
MFLYKVLNGLFLIQQIYSFQLPSLRNIIASRAVLSSIANRVYSEVVSENLLTSELQRVLINPSHEVISTGLIVYFIYLYYNYSIVNENKLEKIKMFSKTRKFLNQIIVVLIYVFSRNIQNAI